MERTTVYNRTLHSAQIESQVGRTETYRWGPRVIDVDILLYGSRQVSVATTDLQILHSRMRERAFVLVPLAEIAGDVLAPPDGMTVNGLLALVDDVAEVERWGDGLTPFNQWCSYLDFTQNLKEATDAPALARRHLWLASEGF